MELDLRLPGTYISPAETGLYYLQSRYYNPEIGRFINADRYVSTGQGILGYNMFAYCNNNPTMGCDPCGTCIHNWKFYNCEKCEAFWNGVDQWYEDAVNYVLNDDPKIAQSNLETNNFSFYKGAMVFSTKLPYMGSAFSFGVIVMDSYYEGATGVEFANTLNHEYGHFVHMNQIGISGYIETVAIPSAVSAAIADGSKTGFRKWMYDNYYSFPTERIADQLGGVNRGYATGANTLGALYWIYTVVSSLTS